MADDHFQQHVEASMQALKSSLITAEESADFEVEDQAGALHISFEDGSKFIISPNSAARQVWISALATSFKLDWSEDNKEFVLLKSGEGLKALVSRLINQQEGADEVHLK